ncbi:type II toxin-antitoxin system VapC family toxin [Vineibacter terrae]|uniref:type II toxin-antitoxin system VapC family toxin n=1 Tax=Vineibacter terrae TaxID=2586908 RepID=UPI0015B64225|nr:PIN domain-containing protein [Vineibacter terrae]
MSLFVDTSVWSLALRRDSPQDGAEVAALIRALESGDPIITTGLVLQELLQGFSGPKSRQAILEHFSSLPFLVPDRDDHITAAELRNQCRRSGLQVGTIDALIAQLCVRHSLTLLTTDRDFAGVAKVAPLKLWHATASVASTERIAVRAWPNPT